MNKNNNQETSTDVINLIKIVVKKWKLLVLITLSTGLLSAGYIYLIKDDIYTSSSSMMIKVSDSGEDYNDLLYGQELIKTYIEISKSNKVLDSIIENLSLGISRDDLNEMISITSLQNALIINISVQGSDAMQTSMIANEFVSVIQEISIEYSGLERVESLDIAVPAINPEDKNITLYIVAGSILGAIIGSLIIISIETLNRKINSAFDVEDILGLKLFGSVPEYKHTNTNLNSNYSVITNDDPSSVVSECYKKLRTSIDYSNFDKKIQVVNVTSTKVHEGKTDTCLNLATVYSQMDKKVLIIDMNLRNPSIHNTFNIPNTGGVTDYVENGGDISQHVQNINNHLDVLVAGEKVFYPVELLQSTATKNMMEELRNIYDMIIIDCPPLLHASDSTIISNLSDTTLYVIASRQTNTDAVKHSLVELQQTGDKNIGVFLTNIKKQDTPYKMFYGY